MTRVTVLIGTRVAHVLGGKWTASNVQLAWALTTLELGREQADYEPDPDLSAAKYAISCLGGQLLLHDGPSDLSSRAVW